MCIFFTGLRDKYRSHLEQGHAFFPFDFPDTKAYEKHSALVARQNAEHFAKRPPAKRINYKKTGIFSPFRYAFYLGTILPLS